jgi:hypothetical protein
MGHRGKRKVRIRPVSGYLGPVKRLVDLTVEDLRTRPVWRYEGGSGDHATVVASRRKSLSQEDDEVFLAATEFALVDGSAGFGFCFPADDAGIDYLQPVIVAPSGHVSFWFDGPATPDLLSNHARVLGKDPHGIFPVTFRCLVPVDGRTVSGRIDGFGSPVNLASKAPAPVILEDTVDADGGPRVPAARPIQPRRDTGPVEKRTARRRKAAVDVEFCSDDVHGTGVIGDLSPRGMFVRSKSIPSPGPMLRLKVNLPDGRTLDLKGRVVRDSTALASSSSPANGELGFGLRLAEDSPDYEELVARLRNKPR